MVLMRSFLGRRLIALLIAIGFCLGGALPALAAPSASGSMPCSMMMPDMPMPSGSMDAQKQAPMKNAPCDNAGCGCCVAGTCAMPSGLIPDASVLVLRQSGKISFLVESLDGISRRPVLPPPILHT